MKTSEKLELSSAQGKWVLTATILGSALTMLTGTVVNVALPAIGKALDAGTSDLQWVLNGYLLAVASLILIGGVLGDKYGRRRLFVIGAIGFGATTLICALAPNIEILIAGRVLQGIASAMLTPESLAIIEASFRAKDRGKAIGAWSALGGIAAAIGPVLGGWLVDIGSWRWIFWATLPVAAAVVWVALRHVPETLDPEAGALDLAGATTLFLGLGGITWALIFAPERELTAPSIWIPALGGLAAFVVFLIVEKKSSEPMVPLKIFGRNQFTAANGVTFVIYAALGGVFFFLVVYLQVALGYKAVTAGAALLPITALMLVLSPKAGDLAQNHGARLLLTTGGVLIAAGMFLMSRIEQGDGYWSSVFPAVTVFGLGLSATVAPVTSAVLAAADDRHSGLASGVNNAVARTAQLIAVAIVPWIAGLTGDEINDPEAMASGFPRAMVAMAGVAFVGALLSLFTISGEPLASDV